VQEAIDNGTSALKGYRNIALFGVDSREGELEKNTRTDTIMIASVNLDTNEIRLCSVMRDTWLNQGNDTYRKANAAYASGGPKQAINMLNMNLDLNITDFVTVGFDGLIDAIEAVGGVEIDVKEAEIEHINNYQISIVGKEDGTLNAAGEPNYVATAYVDYTPVTKAGTQTLNGLQATAYCRVRYVGNDFERTSRQRTVLTKLAKKAMTLNINTLNNIADAVFPQVYTSLSKSEIISLLAGVASYKVGENVNFPFDGYVETGRINKASVVVPVDLQKNVSLLHEFLFDEVGYEPTETVKKCSQKIVSDSGMTYSGD
jgi:LCP family protein required for cell wall assembly